VKGRVDPRTGMAIQLTDLKQLIQVPAGNGFRPTKG